MKSVSNLHLLFECIAGSLTVYFILLVTVSASNKDKDCHLNPERKSSKDNQSDQDEAKKLEITPKTSEQLPFSQRFPNLLNFFNQASL